MSVAGFFDSFFGPAWQRARHKAEKSMKSGDWANAWHFCNDALAAAPDTEKDALTQARTQCGAQLMKLNLERAADLARAREASRCGEHLELAETFAITDELRASFARQKAEIGASLRAAPQPAAKSSQARPEAPAEQEVMFDFVYPGFPEAVLDAYAGRPAAWRNAVLARHSNDLRAALPILRDHAQKGTIERFEYGLLLASTGDVKTALSTLTVAAMAPDAWFHAVQAAVDVAWALEDWAAAEKVLQHALDSLPESVELYQAAATHAILVKRPQEGFDAIDAADALQHDNPRTQLLRARLLDMTGNTAEALPLYEAAVKRSWRVNTQERKIVVDVNAAGFAVTAYLKLRQNYPRAEELLRAMIDGTPDDVKWRIELDLATVMLRRNEEGRCMLLLSDIARRADESSVSGRLRLAWLQRDETEFKARWARALPPDRERFADMMSTRGEPFDPAKTDTWFQDAP
jgi:tetratricopeptide (TPR) repeat protein